MRQMTRLNQLIREAKDSCEIRGHRMDRFQHLGSRAIGTCLICGKSVVANANPMPNEIDIGGEAVALTCAD